MRLETIAAKAPPTDAEKRDLVVGVGFGLVVVLMWASWVVATRFAVTTRLSPFDVAFIRYLVATTVLSPVLFRHGLAFRTLGFGRTAMLVCGAGLPFMLISSTGMSFAPASSTGAVMIGTMPLFVALLSAFFDGEQFSVVRKVGFVCVVIGVACITSQGLSHLQSGAWRGYPFFLLAACLWAGYTIVFRRAGIGAWHAAALISFYSLILVAPIYFLFLGSHLRTASTTDILLQAGMQGIVSAVAGLYFYGQAIRRIGASRAAVITSLTPVAAALLGVALLDELPSALAWVGIVCVSSGVALASGGLLKSR